MKPAVVFVGGALCGPVLTNKGEWLRDFLNGPDISINACLPYKEAKIVMEHATESGLEILGTIPAPIQNNTAAIIRNNSGHTLNNVNIGIYLLAYDNSDLGSLYQVLYFSSIEGGKSIKPNINDKKSSVDFIIPKMNPGEYVFAMNGIDKPASLIVDVHSDELSTRKDFPPGCPGGLHLHKLPPSVVDKYLSSICSINENGSIQCKVESSFKFSFVADSTEYKMKYEPFLIKDRELEIDN